MNKKVQSYLWKTFGTLSNIAFPVAYAGIKWGWITERAASTQVSVYVLLAAIAAIPAIKANLPKLKMNYVGIIIASLGAMGYFIGEIMIQFGACIIAGSVSCGISFYMGDKSLQEYDNNKLAENIALKMSAEVQKE